MAAALTDRLPNDALKTAVQAAWGNPDPDHVGEIALATLAMVCARADRRHTATEGIWECVVDLGQSTSEVPKSRLEALFQAVETLPKLLWSRRLIPRRVRRAEKEQYAALAACGAWPLLKADYRGQKNEPARRSRYTEARKHYLDNLRTGTPDPVRFLPPNGGRVADLYVDDLSSAWSASVLGVATIARSLRNFQSHEIERSIQEMKAPLVALDLLAFFCWVALRVVREHSREAKSPKPQRRPPWLQQPDLWADLPKGPIARQPRTPWVLAGLFAASTAALGVAHVLDDPPSPGGSSVSAALKPDLPEPDPFVHRTLDATPAPVELDEGLPPTLGSTRCGTINPKYWLRDTPFQPLGPQGDEPDGLPLGVVDTAVEVMNSHLQTLWFQGEMGNGKTTEAKRLCLELLGDGMAVERLVGKPGEMPIWPAGVEIVVLDDLWKLSRQERNAWLGYFARAVREDAERRLLVFEHRRLLPTKRGDWGHFAVSDLDANELLSFAEHQGWARFIRLVDAKRWPATSPMATTINGAIQVRRWAKSLDGRAPTQADLVELWRQWIDAHVGEHFIDPAHFKSWNREMAKRFAKAGALRQSDCQSAVDALSEPLVFGKDTKPLCSSLFAISPAGFRDGPGDELTPADPWIRAMLWDEAFSNAAVPDVAETCARLRQDHADTVAALIALRSGLCAVAQ